MSRDWITRLVRASTQVVALSVLRRLGRGSDVRPADDLDRQEPAEVPSPYPILGYRSWKQVRDTGLHVFPSGAFWVAWSPDHPENTSEPVTRRVAERIAQALAKKTGDVYYVMKCQSAHQQQMEMCDWIHVPYGVGAPCPQHGVDIERSSVFSQRSSHGSRRRAA